MIYYKYETNANGVIIAIHSSNVPFNEKMISIENINKIKVGRTTEQELIDMA
jgi:hypothetical protein